MRRRRPLRVPSPARALPIRYETSARSARAQLYQKRPCRPCRERHSWRRTRRLRKSRADHRVSRHELRELLLAPALGALGAHRQHQKARLRGRIPDADFGLLWQGDAEIRKYATRILYRAGAIGRSLVPDWRKPQHFPGITGAQRAHDHVMAGRRVLDRDEMIADPTDMAERAHGFGGVIKQRPLESRVGPGLGDNLRAIVRADLRFVSLDNGV